MTVSILVTLCAKIFTPAYLDPGSGSMLIQILIATLLASLLFLKSYWTKIQSFFLKIMGKKPDNEEPQDDDTSTNRFIS